MMTSVSDDQLEKAAVLFKALANPLRLAIVGQLRDGPKCVHDLVDALDISQPLVSQHLRVLRAANLLAGERRGREVVYALADHHVSHIVDDAVTHVGESDTASAPEAANQPLPIR